MPNLNQQKFLEARDPEYLELVPDWAFWEDSFIGGSRYNQRGHLVRHPREKYDSFNHRLEHAVYQNYTRDTGEDWNSKLFGPGFAASLDKADSTGSRANIVKSWEHDFDLMGNDLYAFFVNAALEAASYGTVGCLIQVYNEMGEQISMLDAEDNPERVRPFATLIPPWNMPRFGLDRYKRLKWVLIRESTYLEKNYTDYVDFPIQNDNELESFWRYYYIDREQIIRFEPRDRGVWSEESIPHNVGRVPFTRISYLPPVRGQFFSRPPTEEISLMGKLIYNLRNGVSQMSESQMFSILVASGRNPPISGEDDEDKTGGSATEVGQSRGLLSPPGADFPPHFISPEADLQRVQREYISDLERAISQIARQGGYSLVDSGGSRDASGRAKAFDIDKLTAFLRKVGKCLGRSFEEILTLYWDRSIFGNEGFEGFIKFPEDFHLRGSIELAEETLALDSAIQESETARKVIRKRFVKAALSQDMTPEEETAISNEIEKAEYMTPFEMDEKRIEMGNAQDPASPNSLGERADARRSDNRSVPGENRAGEQSGPSIKRTPRRRGASK